MSGKYVLAIDQGTTGTRAVVFDRRGNYVQQSYRNITQYYPYPGWVEQDPGEIWQSSLTVIKEVLEAGKIPPHEIIAIGISNQRETALLWDKDTGNPVYRAIVWQCRRTDKICEEWEKSGLGALIREKTGLTLDPYFSASKIKWFIENFPFLKNKIKKGKILFGTVDTYLLWKLSGSKVHLTDYTNASRTMLFNIHNLEWDGEILSNLEIPKEILPEVLPSNSLFGYTANLDFIPAGIPISGILGDQQASLFGHRCFFPGMAKNTYGTECFFLVNCGKTAVTPPRGFLLTLACDERGKPVYALEGSVFIAGAAIEWLKEGLGILDNVAQTESLAKKVKDTAGVYFVPALVGLGAPYWDTKARGAILGITRGTKKEHIVRATLEAIAYQVRDLMELISRESRLKIDKLMVDGGVSNNDFLIQFQADILGLSLERPIEKEVSALGAALMAGLTIGFWDSQDIIHLPIKSEEFLPKMKREKAELLYQGWKKAVNRVLATA